MGLHDGYILQPAFPVHGKGAAFLKADARLKGHPRGAGFHKKRAEDDKGPEHDTSEHKGPAVTGIDISER